MYSPNKQATVPRDYRSDGKVQLHHVFLTIQGEGPFAGRVSVFIRLFGCNLRCPACDTDYTSQNNLVAPVEVLQQVKAAHNGLPHRPLVVISGGEPFRQSIACLVREFIVNDYEVQIETNGTCWDPWFNSDLLPWLYTRELRNKLTIVCSPKVGLLNEDLVHNVDAYKYVVQEGHVDAADGLPTATMGFVVPPARPSSFAGRTVYVQPLDEQDPVRNRANQLAAVASCFRFGYRLSIQTHKIVNLE